MNGRKEDKVKRISVWQMTVHKEGRHGRRKMIKLYKYLINKSKKVKLQLISIGKRETRINVVNYL